jgi:hypothetical protein
MKTRLYRYPPNIQVVKIGGWLMTIIVLVFVVLAVSSRPLALIVSPWEALSVLFLLAFGASVSLYIANLYPNIGVDEQGILVGYLWHYLRVPWQEIIDARPIRAVFGLSLVWLVRTKRLTLLHRLYGFPHTGFFISSMISNYAELIREIEHHVQLPG